MCQRIKLRAIERAGQLLNQLESTKNAGRPKEIKVGADPNKKTRKQAAKDAGMSERQSKQAIQVARAIDKNPELNDTIDKGKPPLDKSATPATLDLF